MQLGLFISDKNKAERPPANNFAQCTAFGFSAGRANIRQIEGVVRRESQHEVVEMPDQRRL
jgi:hypothetical protein